MESTSSRLRFRRIRALERKNEGLMYYSFAFVKFLKTDPPQVKVGDDWLYVILDDVLTVEEIEDLRRLDSLGFE